jgi:hypothetical protein
MDVWQTLKLALLIAGDELHLLRPANAKDRSSACLTYWMR